jgi:hypothetical protein
MRTIPPIASVLLLLLPGAVLAQQPAAELPRTPSPEGAEVYILSPEDGAEVSSPFTVRFGLRGMGVAPAGVQQQGTGHHHLLIDVDELPPENLPLPTTDQVRHFGMGQTETELELEPGQHTLQLVLGDHLHIPHDPPVMSEKITITVVE